MVLLDVQVHDFLRVLLDVLPAGLDGLPHEDREQGIGGRGVLDRDLLHPASRPGERGDAPAKRRVAMHRAESGLVDVQDLPAERERRLALTAATLLRGSAGGWRYDEEYRRLRRTALLAIREFSGDVEAFQ